MGTGKTSLLLYSNILLWEMRKKIVFKMRYWASQVVLVVPVCKCRRREMQVQSLGPEDLLEEGMATAPVFLPGESHGQRSLAGFSS